MVSLLLAGNAMLDKPKVWALFVLAFLGAAFWSLGSPALRSLTPRLVPDDQLAAASALNSVYSNLGAVAGPAMGGLLIATLGLTTTYLIDFASFAASLVAIALLPAIPPALDAGRAGLRSFLEGLRFVRRQPVIMGIFLLDTNAMVFGMPSALFPALAEHRFGGGAGTVGLLYGAPYAGALAGALFSGGIGGPRRSGRHGQRHPALDDRAPATPDAMRGRVSGIELAQVASAPTLGNVEAGVVASFTSLRFSVVSGGIACVLGTLALVATIPALLRHQAPQRDAE